MHLSAVQSTMSESQLEASMSPRMRRSLPDDEQLDEDRERTLRERDLVPLRDVDVQLLDPNASAVAPSSAPPLASAATAAAAGLSASYASAFDQTETAGAGPGRPALERQGSEIQLMLDDLPMVSISDRPTSPRDRHSYSHAGATLPPHPH